MSFRFVVGSRTESMNFVSRKLARKDNMVLTVAVVVMTSPFVKALFLLVNVSVAHALVPRIPAPFQRCSRFRFECWVIVYALSFSCLSSHISFRFVVSSRTKSISLC